MRLNKVWFHCWLLAFAFALPLAAQESPKSSTNKHCLWQVQGASNTVYLLGSIHVLKEEDYPLAAPLEAAFSNSQIAVFETDITAMQKPGTLVSIMAKARLPEGQTLQQQLEASTYERLAKYVKETGVPMQMIEQFKPALAAMLLDMIEMQKLGADPEYGVDKHFTELAAKQGKQIVGLETMDFQIGLVTDLSKEENELVMRGMLKDSEISKARFKELLPAWQTGDGVKLEKLMNDSVSEMPQIFKRLVTDRNQKWLPRIEEWLRGGKNTIVIVGAGHLVGDAGLVELLKKKGHKVTQL